MQKGDGWSIITLRLKPDLHRRLTHAAHDYRMSLNKFCIQTLEQMLEAIERENEK
jgi:predicted HicB family RNase H-like nuclease